MRAEHVQRYEPACQRDRESVCDRQRLGPGVLGMKSAMPTASGIPLHLIRSPDLQFAAAPVVRARLRTAGLRGRGQRATPPAQGIRIRTALTSAGDVQHCVRIAVRFAEKLDRFVCPHRYDLNAPAPGFFKHGRHNG